MILVPNFGVLTLFIALFILAIIVFPKKGEPRSNFSDFKKIFSYSIFSIVFFVVVLVLNINFPY
nr:MAG TPA_asm: hypothetical protein [Bacteriophage sp.]